MNPQWLENHIRKYIRWGWQDALLFTNIMLRKGWSFIRAATKNEDMFELWDILMKSTIGVEIEFEVKGPKNDIQGKTQEVYNRTVAEFVKEDKFGRPHIGWSIASKCKYFALSDAISFSLIRKNNFRQFAESHIRPELGIIEKKHEDIVPSYQMYFRDTKPKERCMFVDFVDLKPITDKKILIPENLRNHYEDDNTR